MKGAKTVRHEREASPLDESTAKDSAGSLSRLEVLRGLRWANWDAIFFTLYLALTSGAFLVGLARFLGANDLWLGIITAVPALTGAIQFLTAYLADRVPSRRALVLRYALWSRLPWVLIALLPVMDAGLPRKELFVALLILSSVFGSFAAPAFLAWLTDLVPPSHRGRYFGRRNMILGLVAAAAALPPALFLDRMVKSGQLASALGFATLFGLGALCLFLSLWSIARMPDVPREPVALRGLHGFLAFYREPFRSANFRYLLMFNTIFVFGHMFAGQFFTVYMLEQIRMPYLMVQVAGLIMALFSSLSMPFWGYLADKFGNRPLLLLSGLGVVFLPFLWFLTHPAHYGWSVGVILGIQVLAGVLWAGVGLTQFNLNVAVAPPEQRALYMGALSAIVAVTTGLANLLSGAAMEWMKPYVPDPLRFFVLFGMASLFRLLALPWLTRVHEAEGLPTRYVMRQLRASVRPRGWLAMRQLRRQADEASRLQAVRTLAAERTALAVEELVQALHDPSIEVRREAARALGEIGDPRAVPALLQMLNDPTSGIRVECAEALGKIGDRGALPHLLAMLQAEQIEARLAATQALRQLGDAQALPALLERLQQAPGPLEQSRLLEAIGHLLPNAASETLRTSKIEAVLMPYLRSPYPEVRAETAIAVASLPPDPNLAVAVGRQLTEEQEPTVMAALARALAYHGSPDDLPLLMETLARGLSPLVRQQIALAIARLLQRDETLYALLTADEMSRDRLIERVLAPRLRELPALSDALRAYAYGDYGSAIQILLDSMPHHPRLHWLRHAPPTLESWLLAVSLI
jgi:HEAT repeat protein/Na+/melibiose symporter-like transporter